MTGPEQASLNDFRHETREELAGFRTELQALRADMAPAIALAAHFSTLGRALSASGVFIKWGTGVGASVGGMLVVLKAFGIL